MSIEKLNEQQKLLIRTTSQTYKIENVKFACDLYAKSMLNNAYGKDGWAAMLTVNAMINLWYPATAYNASTKSFVFSETPKAEVSYPSLVRICDAFLFFTTIAMRF